MLQCRCGFGGLGGLQQGCGTGGQRAFNERQRQPAITAGSQRIKCAQVIGAARGTGVHVRRQCVGRQLGCGLVHCDPCVTQHLQRGWVRRPVAQRLQRKRHQAGLRQARGGCGQQAQLVALRIALVHQAEHGGDGPFHRGQQRAQVVRVKRNGRGQRTIGADARQLLARARAGIARARMHIFGSVELAAHHRLQQIKKVLRVIQAHGIKNRLRQMRVLAQGALVCKFARVQVAQINVHQLA